MSIFSKLFGATEPEPDDSGAEPDPDRLLPAPAESTFGGYLRAARNEGASDLHVVAGSVPFAKVEGQLLRFDADVTSSEQLLRWVAELRQSHGLGPGWDEDLALELPEIGRFRLNVHHQRRGPAIAVKLVPQELPTLSSLGLPEELYGLTDHRQGLVLVTGPAGCGKTSTLAALVSHLESTRPDHVVTIEDPIEFVFGDSVANVTQREVGPHTRTFEGALRAALREDPDVIVVSELRDIETIRTAIVAAETGHLVMGTLHTRDAISTINRLLDLFPAREREQVRTMLAATLRTVVSQRLVERRGGGRRVCAYEILHVTPAASTHIREGRTHQLLSLLQTGRKHGMIDLDARLQQLLKDGDISLETARRNAKDVRRFGDDDA